MSLTIENVENVLTVENVPKKRGRKSKKELEKQSMLSVALSNQIDTKTIVTEDLTINQEPLSDNQLLDSDAKPFAKKRGRKPKGGKIVSQIISNGNTNETMPNVILHLKCSTKDLTNNVPTNDHLEIESYTFENKSDLSYDIINASQNQTSSNKNQYQPIIEDEAEEEYCQPVKDTKSKEIWTKLKQLEQNLHINQTSSDKKPACFWCTYDFDNPAIYIPKHYIKNSYHVYGCFCSPECSVAFLMNENIDSSVKFERYHLINHFYAKIFNYEKNIKPAPDPYYMLEKYYGNLTIQEYRSLLRNERLFLVVDKPMTRIMPELHEDNDEFILNNKIIPTSTLNVKKKIQKKTQNKNNIVNEQFGLV